LFIKVRQHQLITGNICGNSNFAQTRASLASSAQASTRENIYIPISIVLKDRNLGQVADLLNAQIDVTFFFEKQPYNHICAINGWFCYKVAPE